MIIWALAINSIKSKILKKNMKWVIIFHLIWFWHFGHSICFQPLLLHGEELINSFKTKWEETSRLVFPACLVHNDYSSYHGRKRRRGLYPLLQISSLLLWLGVRSYQQWPPPSKGRKGQEELEQGHLLLRLKLQKHNVFFTIESKHYELP